MDKVSIYIHTNIRSRLEAAGFYIYVIAFMTVKGEATATDKQPVRAGWKGAELLALLTALKRLTKPCEVTVYVENPLIESAFNNGWLKKWSDKGFVNSKGTPIEEAETWRGIYEIIQNTGHEVKITTSKEHSYMSWLKAELGEETEKAKSQYSCYREQIAAMRNTLESLDASAIEENEELRNAIILLTEGIFEKFPFLQNSTNSGFVKIENAESMENLSSTEDGVLTNTEFTVH